MKEDPHDTAMLADRAYFAAHPEHRYRLREMIAGEFDGAPDGQKLVELQAGLRWVTLVHNMPGPGDDEGHGVRFRLPVYMPAWMATTGLSQEALERLYDTGRLDNSTGPSVGTLDGQNRHRLMSRRVH